MVPVGEGVSQLRALETKQIGSRMKADGKNRHGMVPVDLYVYTYT